LRFSIQQRRRSAAGFDTFSEFADSSIPGSVRKLVANGNDKSHRPLDYFKTAPLL